MDSIKECEFVSIDLEFSGIHSSLMDQENEFDTVEERYQKVRSVIHQFVAFQVGLCCWRWDNADKKYKYRPFNFYVWPKSKVLDRSMMFSVSTLKNSFC